MTEKQVQKSPFDDFVGYRELSVLTTGSFCNYILVVSTTFDNDNKKGETALAKVMEINSMTID